MEKNSYEGARLLARALVLSRDATPLTDFIAKWKADPAPEVDATFIVDLVTNYYALLATSKR